MGWWKKKGNSEDNREAETRIISIVGVKTIAVINVKRCMSST